MLTEVQFTTLLMGIRAPMGDEPETQRAVLSTRKRALLKIYREGSQAQYQTALATFKHCTPAYMRLV